MKSQVTTKRGDTGSTVTIAGDTVSKSHAILECCGQIDLLRAETALCRLQLLESGHAESAPLGDFLFWLMHVYFLMGSQCNDPLNRKPEYRRADVGPEHIARLEKQQAAFESAVSLPKQFVLSAGSIPAARLDVLCTIARSAERSVVRLKEAEPAFAAEHLIVFLNRLSDTLFMMARYLDEGRSITVDYAVLER